MSTATLSPEEYLVTSTKSVFCGTKNTPKYFVLYPAKSAGPVYRFSEYSIVSDEDPKNPVDPALKDSMSPP